MDRNRNSRKLAVGTLAALAMVLSIAGPSVVAAEGGHGGGGAHPGDGGHALEGHGFERHGFDGHRDFDDHGLHREWAWGYPYYYGYGPAYGPGTVDYYWYCPSYGAYYPSVDSCPEEWVPVPVS